MSLTTINKLISLALLLILSISKLPAQTPYQTPSGHIVYIMVDGHDAHITSPNNNHNSESLISPSIGYESWSGYSKPGGRLVIPDSVLYNRTMYPVRYISPFAFYKCSSLTSVVIPNTVTEIGGRAFSECSGLRSVTIGTNVANLGYGAFNGRTTSLDTVYYNANYIGNISPTPSQDLYSLYIWSTTDTAIIIVGDNVTQIKSGVFRGGCRFKNIIMGSALTQIGPLNTFRNNMPTGITTTVFKSQNPPYLGVGVSFDADSNTCIVPCGRASFYFNQWSTRFASYNEMPSGVSISVGVSNPNHGIAQIIQNTTCDSTAIISATPFYGYLFTQWNDGDSNNPRTVHLTNPSQHFIAQFSINPGEPDTIFIHDTTIITNYLYDTIYLPIYLHDTISIINYLHDTIYLPQYIHDTTIINSYIHDTIYLPQYIHDTNTILVPVHDTTYINISDTVVVHDTIYIYDTINVGMKDVDVINAKIHISNGQIIVYGAEDNIVRLYDVHGRLLATKQDEFSPLKFDVSSSGTYLIKIGNHKAHKVVVVR